MKKGTKAAPKLPAGSMLQQKTNEDFNKKKPDPADPNEQEGQLEILPEGVEEAEIKLPPKVQARRMEIQA